MKINILAIFVLALILAVIVFQSQKSPWHPHMFVDISAFYSKISYLSENNTLRGIPQNEYQPGAILFFILASFFSSDLTSFGSAFLWITIALAIVLSYFYFLIGGSKNIFLFGAILLSTGSIIFFRFEVFVGLLVVAALYLFLKNKFVVSLFLLGFATLTKIYPAILIPFLLFLIFKKKNLGIAVLSFLSYLSGFFIPLYIYMIGFQVSVSELIAGITFHGYKPVSLESIWASGITFINLLQGNQVKLAGGWGIWGISPDIIGNLFFYNYFWLVPLGITYVLILSKLKSITNNMIIKVSILLILIMLFFTKVLAPQYLLWFTLLVPMLNFTKLSKIWVINLILIFTITALTQIIYPLNYEKLLDFYKGSGDQSIFWLDFLKNTLLGILLVNIYLDVFRSLDESKLQDSPQTKS